MSKETSKRVASMASKIMNKHPLDDRKAMEELGKAMVAKGFVLRMTDPNMRDPVDALTAVLRQSHLGQYVEDAQVVAASALGQTE